MAKVLGEAGRYVINQAVAARRKIWLVCVIGIALVSLVEGIILSRWLLPAQLSRPAGISVVLGLFAFMLGLYKWSDTKMDRLERKRSDMARGAAGERIVELILQEFPDDFCVIHDLTTPFGNLDHVVIGPTGVFVIDTKNWRGVVAPDGKGELLLNGKPTDKAFVRQFIARMMSVRDKVG